VGGLQRGNLEKIFRLIRALGRCIVFIDEADQTLGKRDSAAATAACPGACTR
jgi:SpoVK/Ycf46/Vps4 family AAA+-type ATPase